MGTVFLYQQHSTGIQKNQWGLLFKVCLAWLRSLGLLSPCQEHREWMWGAWAVCPQSWWTHRRHICMQEKGCVSRSSGIGGHTGKGQQVQNGHRCRCCQEQNWVWASSPALLPSFLPPSLLLFSHSFPTFPKALRKGAWRIHPAQNES